MLSRTPFLKDLEEELQIRRPDPQQPFGYEVRGSFKAVVREQRFQLNTDLNLNVTERRFDIAISPALPLAAVSDASDPDFEKDLQEDDHLIRLKFFSASEIDTETKLKDIQGNVLQVVSIEAYAKVDAMLLEAVELGSL